MPAFPWLTSLVGAIMSALVQFCSLKAGSLLVGLGVSIAIAKGLDNIIQFVIGDMQFIASSLSGGGGYGGLAGSMLQLAAYCGLPDGINIVLSAVITSVGIKQSKVFLKRVVG